MRKKLFFKKLKVKNGFALMTALFVMMILLILGVLFISITNFAKKTSKNSTNATKAFYIAESGMNKAIWSINRPALNYTGESDTNFSGGKFTTTVVEHPTERNKRIITSTGYFPLNATFPAKRKIQVTVTANPTELEGAFHYALHVGVGGLIMSNGSQITGDVYSNGNILPYSGQTGTITGSVWVATDANRIEKINIGLDAHAYTIKDANITRDAYYSEEANLINTTVGGTKHSGQTSPQTIDLPIKAGDESMIAWENYASDGGSQGSVTVTRGQSLNLGPKKIEGNLTVENNATLIVQGVIWVTGNILLENGSTVKLDPAIYEDNSGVILSDNAPSPGGKITVQNGCNVQGTGIGDSYLMLLTTNTGSTTDNYAMDAGNTSESAILYATDGIVWLENNSHLKEVTAYKIWLKQNAIITYEEGLADPKFISGPGGLWVIENSTWNEIY